MKNIQSVIFIIYFEGSTVSHFSFNMSEWCRVSVQSTFFPWNLMNVYYIFSHEILDFIYWMKEISTQAVMFTFWNISKMLFSHKKIRKRSWRHVIWCSKENEINRNSGDKSLVLRTRENKKILSHSRNKFYIKRQTIEYPLFITYICNVSNYLSLRPNHLKRYWFLYICRVIVRSSSGRYY